MSPDRPSRRFSDRLAPLALAARRALPDEVRDETRSIPFARIARYACYALVVFAVGLVCAGIVHGFFGLLYGLLHDVPPLARLAGDLADLLRDAIEAFFLLVALGVFLTGFERR